jgi:hypothetical protein
MDPIPKAGYYYPNKAARITLESLESVMGKNGLNAILNLAHMPHLIDNYPPNNLDREFDFADFTAINWALEEMYGPRGGRGLALRPAAPPSPMCCVILALAGVGDRLSKSCHCRLNCVSACQPWRIFSQISDQHSTVVEQESEFIYTIYQPAVLGT